MEGAFVIHRFSSRTLIRTRLILGAATLLILVAFSLANATTPPTAPIASSNVSPIVLGTSGPVKAKTWVSIPLSNFPTDATVSLELKTSSSQPFAVGSREDTNGLGPQLIKTNSQGTVTLKPTADSSITKEHADTNYGTLPLLYLESTRDIRSYTKFTVPSPTQTATYSLRVYAYVANPTGFSIRLTKTSWTETGNGSITYNNRPGYLDTTTPPTTSTTTTTKPPVTTTTTTPPVSGTNCAPNPHLCGYPDATNTGVPAGTVLKRVPQDVTSGSGWHYDDRGWVVIDGNGTVFDSFKVNMGVVVEASNVTISRSEITVDGEDSYGVTVGQVGVPVANTIIKDSYLHGSASGNTPNHMYVGVMVVYTATNSKQRCSSNLSAKKSCVHGFPSCREFKIVSISTLAILK